MELHHLQVRQFRAHQIRKRLRFSERGIGLHCAFKQTRKAPRGQHHGGSNKLAHVVPLGCNHATDMALVVNKVHEGIVQPCDVLQRVGFFVQSTHDAGACCVVDMGDAPVRMPSLQRKVQLTIRLLGERHTLFNQPT